MVKMNEIPLEKVIEVVKSKGYKVFENEGILNTVGVRSNETDGSDYDDNCYSFYKLPDGRWKITIYTITTNPGKYYLNNPIPGSKGTAIVVPGQYPNMWKIGLHKGQQKAFVQVNPVRVYRDSNRNDVLDYKPETIETGLFGINGHHGSIHDVDIVDRWSAGCQVWRYHAPHQAMIETAELLSKKYQYQYFTYTLLEQKDFA
jgi:hypothetical protein